jgi:hypothetical protein
MAVLTWRNVDAPSDRGNSAVSGLATAARLLDSSTSGLADGLGKFGQAQTTLANNAAAQAASRFQDADALKAALSDGSLLAGLQGVDPSRVDANTVAGLNSQVSDLLNQKGKGLSNDTVAQQLHDTQYAQTRLEDRNRLVDEAKPAFNELILASKSRDANRIAAAQANPALAALPSDLFTKMMTDATAQEQGRASLTGTDLTNTGQRLTNENAVTNNARNSFNFGNEKTDRADLELARSTAQQLEDVTSPLEALTKYKELSTNLSPGASQLVRQQLEQRFGPIFGGASGASPSGGIIGSPGSGTGAAGAIASAVGSVPTLGGLDPNAGDAGTLNGGKYNVTFGYKKTDVPITTMSIGELTKDGGLMDQMIADPKLKNSPIGAYQINKDTLVDFAKRLKLPADTKFTPEIQDKIGQAIFEERKNRDLTDTWSSLKNVPGASKVGAFKNKSWDEMKDFISQNEGTAKAQTAAELRNESQTLMSSLQGLVTDRNQKMQLVGNTGYEKALAVTRSGDPASEASRLIASVPAFKGADAGWLTDEINMVSKRANLTAPQAAEFIQSYMKSNQGGLANFADTARTLGGLLDPRQTSASPNLPSGQRIDDAALEAAIRANKDGSAVNRYAQYQSLQAKNAQTVAAAQALQQASVDLANARRLAAANPRWTGLPLAEKAYAQAVANARLSMASAANNGKMELASSVGQ